MSPKDPGSAFERLVADHHASVYAAALRIVRDPATAEDVAQEVFVQALKPGAERARAENPRRALCWMASRTALMHLRAVQSRRRRETVHAMTNSDRTDAPDDLARAAEEQGALQRFLDRLGDELRLPLVLRFQDDRTFAEIGAALEIAAPTAHERVRLGLARLRAQLKAAGYGVLAVRLEDRLAEPAPVAVPAGLEAALLALGNARAPLLAALPAGLAAAAIALLAVALALRPAPAAGGGASGSPATVLTAALAGDGERPSAPPPPRAAERAAAEEAPAPRTDAAAAHSTGALAGTVVDRESGRGVPDLEVKAASTEREGKFPRFEAAGRTDAEGRYLLAVPVAVNAGQDYRVSAWFSGARVGAATAAARANAGTTTEVEPIALDARSLGRSGEFALDVTVLDAGGQPVAGAYLHLYKDLGRAPQIELAEPDASARTDANGRATLAGTWLGAKSLKIWPGEDSPHPITWLPIELREAGRTETTIRLAPALAIAGTLGAVDPGELAEPRIYAIADGGGTDWHFAAIAADGSFRIEKLLPGTYTVHARANGRSSAERTAVAAGALGVDFRLKRREDETDRGDHLAEIHGRILDSATGEPVELSWPEIEAVAVPDLSPEALAFDVLPAEVFPPSRQTAIGPDAPLPSAEVHAVDLPPGTYVLRARASGKGTAFAGPFRLGAGEIARGALLRLAPAAAIEGVVVDGRGEPVADAALRILGTGPASDERLAALDRGVQSGGSRNMEASAHATTDATGRFRIAGLPADLPLRLAVCHPNYAPAVTPVLALAAGAVERGQAVRLTVPRER